MSGGSAALWALSAAAPSVDAVERERFAGRIDALIPVERGWVPLVTCQRVELYGAGEPMPVSGAGVVRLATGPEAIRHLVRLAVGLESAAVGEGQVLHQLRDALRGATTASGSSGAGPVDPILARTWQVALRAGRRARSGHAARPKDLGDLAVAWLRSELGSLDGRRVLVVGAGAIGTSLARVARSAGAKVLVATRTPAARSGTPLLDLDDAADAACSSDAIAVALRGTWAQAAGLVALPPVVDLSFPGALAPAARAGARAFADVDALAAAARTNPGSAYRQRAERLVDDAVEDVERWLAARPSSARIRALRERADADRQRALDRLFRRLPDLDRRERALVTALSEQLVAGLLHRPTAALGRDVDGSAAAAADRLFGS